MNEAWISARAGYAVVVTPDDYFVMEAGKAMPPRECAPGLLNNLRGLATDVLRTEAGAFPFPQVQHILDAAWRRESALMMVLMALDRQLSHELRTEVAGIASRLLADEDVRNVVRWRLLGTRLPPVADVDGAPLGGIAADLVSEARASRDLVTAISNAWNQSAFQNQKNQRQGNLAPDAESRLRQACVLHGGFAALVDTLRSGDGGCFSQWLSRVQATENILSDSSQVEFLGEWYREAVGQSLKEKAAQLEESPNHQKEFRPFLERAIAADVQSATRDEKWIRLVDRHSFPGWAVECLPRLFVPVGSEKSGYVIALLWHRFSDFLRLYSSDLWRVRTELCDGFVIESEIKESIFHSLRSVVPYLDRLRSEVPLSKKAERGLIADAMASLEKVEAKKGHSQTAASAQRRRRVLLKSNDVGFRIASQ